MQEVVINTWCDRHAVAGEHVAGEAFSLSLPGHAGRELDLCQPCRSDLIDELLELVATRSRPAEQSAGAKAGKTRPTPAPRQLELGQAEGFPCPVCTRVSVSYPALEMHVRKNHGSSLPQLVGTVCPVCGVDKVGLGYHAVQAHKSTNLLDLLRMGAELGDPFGAVAGAAASFEAAAA